MRSLWSEPLRVDRCASGIDSPRRVPEDGGMGRTQRVYSTEYKLGVVQEYLRGEGGKDSIAHRHKISPSLVSIWVDKYQRGELSEDMERKIGQLTMEVYF